MAVTIQNVLYRNRNHSRPQVNIGLPQKIPASIAYLPARQHLFARPAIKLRSTVKDRKYRAWAALALDLLAEQQLKVGDAANAYITRKAHQALDKELSIDMVARKISALEGKLERERSDAERAMLERDNAAQALTLSRQKIMIALIAGLAVLLLIASLLYWRYCGVKRSQAGISASRDKLAQMHTSLIDSIVAGSWLYLIRECVSCLANPKNIYPRSKRERLFIFAD